jgi:restriction endonuclease Mrr
MLESAPIPGPISLRQFEVLIGLVDRPDEQPAPIVGFNSLARQVEAVLLRPMTIHQISPRRFEELVAFGLEKSGFDEVRLTPQTRDGGFDIEAFRYRPIRERLLVECKRYAASRKVGRPTLDALLGVLHREKANQALLATTSSFSKEALGLLKDEQWRLQGMDLDDLLKFLRGLRPN